MRNPEGVGITEENISHPEKGKQKQNIWPAHGLLSLRLLFGGMTIGTIPHEPLLPPPPEEAITEGLITMTPEAVQEIGESRRLDIEGNLLRFNCPKFES